MLIARFEIEGHVTGFGHPDWARTHDSASGTSPVVSCLVEAGATCIGKTVVDELSYGYASYAYNVKFVSSNTNI